MSWKRKSLIQSYLTDHCLTRVRTRRSCPSIWSTCPEQILELIVFVLLWWIRIVNVVLEISSIWKSTMVVCTRTAKVSLSIQTNAYFYMVLYWNSRSMNWIVSKSSTRPWGFSWEYSFDLLVRNERLIHSRWQYEQVSVENDKSVVMI